VLVTLLIFVLYRVRGNIWSIAPTMGLAATATIWMAGVSRTGKRRIFGSLALFLTPMLLATLMLGVGGLPARLVRLIALGTLGLGILYLASFLVGLLVIGWLVRSSTTERTSSSGRPTESVES
jgi:hypothetical protein